MSIYKRDDVFPEWEPIPWNAEGPQVDEQERGFHQGPGAAQGRRGRRFEQVSDHHLGASGPQGRRPVVLAAYQGANRKPALEE
jgi:hypothetical protein